MGKYWVIVKEDKFFSNGKWTSNYNLAYTYETEEDAKQVASVVGGKVVKM